MRAGTSARAHIELLKTIYPVFEAALPQIKSLPRKNLGNVRLQNDASKLKLSFRAIPLVLSSIDIDQELGDAKNKKLLTIFNALFEVLETLVAEDVLRDCDDLRSIADELASETKLCSLFPKLTRINESLRKSSPARPETSDVSDASTKGPDDFVHELAAYVDFLGLDKQSKFNSRNVADSIRAFRCAAQDLLDDPVDVLERNLGNAETLSDDEITFVRKAFSSSVKLNRLYAMLSKSSFCANAHDARLHLSGFWQDGLSFELFTNGCNSHQWGHVRYKWDNEKPPEHTAWKHGFCHPVGRLKASPKRTCIAFNDHEVWDEPMNDFAVDYEQSADELQPLCQVLLRPYADPQDLDCEEIEFEKEDQKVIEFDLACSLVHLDTTKWLNVGLDTNSVLLLATPVSRRRWKPHIKCPLTTASLNTNHDDAIVSFGLLLMEMEARRIARPKEEDLEWATGEISRSSMLKRVLRDWNRAVSDGYRQIAAACLDFQKLRDRAYNPCLSYDMKRAAAIYRFVLAPLYQLITQQYAQTIHMFEGFPRSSLSDTNAASRPSSWCPGSHLQLFDGSDPNESIASDREVKWASEFMGIVEAFTEKIDNISSKCKIPQLSPWRSEKLRIAIIDTGVDDDDTLIGSALECERIKNCCGFINGRDDLPDPHDYQDQHGHGTHVARLILDIARSADIFIAKVSNDASIRPTDLHRIARAIKWAHEDMKVHIISMSFGIESSVRDKEIDRAIQSAFKSNVAIFAAAANSGGNKPRAYPSNRSSGVICIHASDGRGNDGGISPTPEPKKDNFSTLGMGIRSRWKGKWVIKSGTSFATPIAAALAANVLEFARHKCEFDEEELQLLYHVDGIRQILQLLAYGRYGYDYIMPFHLWSKETTEQDIVRKITRIVRG